MGEIGLIGLITIILCMSFSLTKSQLIYGIISVLVIDIMAHIGNIITDKLDRMKEYRILYPKIDNSDLNDLLDKALEKSKSIVDNKNIKERDYSLLTGAYNKNTLHLEQLPTRPLPPEGLILREDEKRVPDGTIVPPTYDIVTEGYNPIPKPPPPPPKRLIKEGVW